MRRRAHGNVMQMALCIYTLFAAALRMVLSSVSPAMAAPPDDGPAFVDLAPGDEKAGYMVVGIQHSEAPAGWSINWHVAVYAPSGLRIGLGRLEDSGSTTGTLAVRLPSGRHRLEIATGKPDRTHGSGAFDFDQREWVPPSDETTMIAETVVEVSPAAVSTVQFRYDAPKALKSEDKVSKTILMLAQNPRISVAPGATASLPTTKPKPHTFMVADVSFATVDQAAVLRLLIAGKDKDELAATALLKSKTIAVDGLVEGLTLATAKPTWGLARVVSRVRDKRLLEPLLAMLKRTPIAERSPLLWALGELEDARAVPALSAAATSGARTGRAYATYALARLHSADAVPALKKALDDSGCADYQSIVTLADPEMGAYYALVPGKGWEPAVPLPSFCLRVLAIYGLGQAGGDDALEALLPLTSADDEATRQHACQSLSRFQSPAAIAALARRIEDNAKVQFIAVAALGAIGTPGTKDALKRFAEEGKDEITRSTAKSALEKKPSAPGQRPARRKGP